MDPKQYLTELESALEQYRFREVRALTDQIDPAIFDLPQIKKARIREIDKPYPPNSGLRDYSAKSLAVQELFNEIYVAAHLHHICAL